MKEGFWGWGVCGWIGAVRDGNGGGWVVSLAAYGGGSGSTPSSGEIHGLPKNWIFFKIFEKFSWRKIEKIGHGFSSMRMPKLSGFRSIFCFGRCRLRQEIEHRFLTDFFKKSCRNLLDLAGRPGYARVWGIFGIWQPDFWKKNWNILEEIFTIS